MAGSRVRFGLVVAVISFSIASGMACGERDGQREERPERPQHASLTDQIPRLVRAVCKQTERQVTVTVVCPPLVPRTRLVRDPDLYGPLVFFPDTTFYLLSFNNGDVGARYLHWIVGKGDSASAERILLRDDQNVVEGLPRLLSEATVDGRTLRLYRYPPHPAGGPNGGHVAALVDCGTEVVVVSLHGPERAGAAREMAFALADSARCPR